jgi:hypothetical protein
MIERAIVKNMSLLTAILTIFFMLLVVIYQKTTDHRDLATDLTIAFADYKNNGVK